MGQGKSRSKDSVSADPMGALEDEFLPESDLIQGGSLRATLPSAVECGHPRWELQI